MRVKKKMSSINVPIKKKKTVQHNMNTVCLNMIVKNESAIIERCLNAVYPFIDEYCIVDTGSTDDTIDKIENFFKEKKMDILFLIK